MDKEAPLASVGAQSRFQAKYEIECLERLGKVQNDSFSDGLVLMLQEMRGELRATAIGVLWYDSKGGNPAILHRMPDSGAGSSLLDEVAKNGQVRGVLKELADTGEEQAWAEPSPDAPRSSGWHEIVLLQAPPLHYGNRQPGLFVLIIDRLFGRTPDISQSILNIRPLLAAVKAIVGRVEWHRSALEHAEHCVRQGAGPGGDAAKDLRENRRAVKAMIDGWSSLMSSEHVARVDRLLHAFWPDAEKDRTEREILERDLLQRWERGVALRRALGIDVQLWHPDQVARVIVDWTPYIETAKSKVTEARMPLSEWNSIDLRRRRLVKAALAEFDPAKHVGSESLGVYFIARALDWPEDRLRYWGSLAPSGAEVSEMLSHTGRLVHHLLAGLPLDGKTIQALTWALSEYVHHGLGIPDQIDLRAHLGLAGREEPALHTLRRFYRDHFFHAMEVCFLGHFLLELRVHDVPLWGLASSGLGNAAKKEDVLKLWYLAALLHDVGYAVDMLKGMKDLCRLLGTKEPLGAYSDGIDAAIRKVSKLIAKERFHDYGAEDSPGEDHGVVGARHLQSMLEEISKDDPRVHVAEFDPAIRAIALHNSHKHRISFAQHPLSFLLVLCDTIQEWKRPTLPFSSAAAEIGAWLLAPAGQANRLPEMLLGAKVQVALVPGQSGEFQLKGDKLRVTLEFGERITHDWSVYNLWLASSYNLQRLDFAGLDLDIDLEFITPQFWSRSKGHYESHLYRLRDAARETHMGFLERWFPSRATGDGTGAENRVLTYRPDNDADPPTDRLTLHLRPLSEEKPLSKDMSTFRDCMKRWRHRDEGWQFVGDYGSPETLPVSARS